MRIPVQIRAPATRLRHSRPARATCLDCNNGWHAGEIMSRNTGESGIRRAAGLILWRLEHQKPRGGGHWTWPEILAEVTHREPQLTEAQLRFAVGWANAARQFRDLARGDDQSLTIEQLREMSGIEHFANRDNWPGDE